MSTTIGIGAISNNDRDYLTYELKKIADRYGYSVLEGTGMSDLDVRSGIASIEEKKGWNCVFLLEAPRDIGAAMAFGIREEIYDFEVKRKRPDFFDFLLDLEDFFKEGFGKVFLFFASEWKRDDVIRYGYGTVKDLVATLSMPGGWEVRYFDPKRDVMYDNDEAPFLFEIIDQSFLNYEKGF